MTGRLILSLAASSVFQFALLAETPEEAAETRITATIVPGGTKTYTTPEHWDTGVVPNGYHVDVVIDNDPMQNTTVNFNGQSTTRTNGVMTIDEGDALSIATSYAGGGTTLNLWTSCITNNGTITFGNVKKNGQNYYIHAYDSARGVNYPSYNGPAGVITVQSMNYQGCTHRMHWLLGGSVNDGTITINSIGAQYQYAGMSLEGGGTFTNNGTITVKATGGYSNNKPGNSSLGFYGGASVLAGSGTVYLDLSERAANGTQSTVVSGAGLDVNLVHGVDHSIVGEGTIDNCRLINEGLVRSAGTNANLNIRMVNRRSSPAAMTNAVTGRIIADSAKGIYLYNSSRPNYNTHFINKGLLEARTGSMIQFANGVNTTSTTTKESDLGDLDGQYLELWGKVAGGGSILSARRIYIADGAKLMPGDTVSDEIDAESTCGTLTFNRLVLREPAAIEDSEETTSGAITEFQCRKPEAGEYDAVWVNGDATVAGTFRFLEQPHGGTYPIFTSTGTLTCDLPALKIELADGVHAPKLRLNTEATYSVEEPVLDETSGEPVLDEETGLPMTKTVDYPCQRIEATWNVGFSLFIR